VDALGHHFFDRLPREVRVLPPALVEFKAGQLVAALRGELLGQVAIDLLAW
jgi:hypothetical protein